MFEEYEDCPPPAEVSQELFAQWRAPRRGQQNPEKLDNPSIPHEKITNDDEDNLLTI